MGASSSSSSGAPRNPGTRNPPIGAPTQTGNPVNGPSRAGVHGGSPLTHSSAGSSRNQSPRTTAREDGVGSVSAAAKKRVARHPHRNSANFSSSGGGSSTLQEDLMKLISPEYEEEHQQQALQRAKVTKFNFVNKICLAEY